MRRERGSNELPTSASNNAQIFPPFPQSSVSWRGVCDEKPLILLCWRTKRRKHVVGPRCSYLWAGRPQRRLAQDFKLHRGTIIFNRTTMEYHLLWIPIRFVALNPMIPVPPPIGRSGESFTFDLQAVCGAVLPPDEETKSVALKEVERWNGKVGLGINVMDTLSMPPPDLRFYFHV
ncbi:hypothetical protein D9613_012793 [Agrocybe pediades]|uniref:Uncharacterized protein n=1 Tax=Agrocybe pediades TaxID=84607 RepID=A0A8H4R3B8_9AGAR|nr:hypothetical protein D9613_012793 [Agrocybe pediades]